MKSFNALIIGVFITLFSYPLAAQEFSFPLACRAGMSCWILSYPDLDAAAESAKDYACGPATSDDEKFLRIGLSDVSALRQNIPVLAAGDGVVIDAADGVPDLVIAARAQLKTGTPLCGNGIVIDHGLGLQTAYCHLRRGSIIVRKGDRVIKGQPIAAAGQSGLATWPQLGFSIRKGGYFIDPITGSSPAEGCGFKPKNIVALPALFQDYQPAAIVALGFSINPITPESMIIGDAPRFARINSSEKTINLWTMILGVHQGDRIEVRLRDPRNRTFYYQDVIADADYERMPLNISRSRGFSDWRMGGYTGEITLTRTIENRPVSVSRSVTVLVK